MKKPEWIGVAGGLLGGGLSIFAIPQGHLATGLTMLAVNMFFAGFNLALATEKK